MRIDHLTAALFNHLAENPMILDKLTADAGQPRTMDDYYGYTVEYGPHSGQIWVRLTDDQPGRRAVKFVPLDEPLADKLRITYDELMAELQN